MNRAFTVIELLVCITMVGLLMGLLFPVFHNARQTSLKAQSVSNMKQVGMAVLLYSTWNDERGYPPLAKDIEPTVPRSILCSPLDDWNRLCLSAPSKRPMLGSYGYVPDIFDSSYRVSGYISGYPDFWMKLTEKHGAPALLVDPFEAETSSCPYLDQNSLATGDPLSDSRHRQFCRENYPGRAVHLPPVSTYLDTALALKKLPIPRGYNAAWSVWMQVYMGAA